MIPELRPYQRESIDAIYDYFGAKTGNPLVVVPTGGGKSIILASFIKEAIAAWPETRILMVTHQKELIAQNFAALLRLWPNAPAGIYSAGLSRRDINAQILFAGIQSIHKHAARIQRCDLVLIDEAHLISRNDGSMYRRFLAELDAINSGLLKVIGFTATPYRMDSGLLHKGKDRLFTDIAHEVKILPLIEQGYLSPLVPKTMATKLDTTGVGTRGGDYIQSQLERAVDKESVNRSAVAEIVEYGQDRGSWLIFCAGIDHAEHVRDIIREHNVSCETITGETPQSQRDAWLNDFKRGELRALTNVGVLTTGIDAPGIDLIAFLRPTKSLSLYLQMAGRGMRLAPGKEDCLVLDFASLTRTFGPIDTVDGDKKQKGDVPGEAPSKICPECEERNHASAKLCVSCGFEFPPPKINISEKSASDAILSTQIQPKWLDILHTSFALHNKPDKPASLKVSYHCLTGIYQEWICFSHMGYPRQKAEAWWRKRTSTSMPRNTEEAFARTTELTKTTAIQVKPVGKYTEILNYKLDDAINQGK